MDMTLRKEDVPYNKGGSDELIPDIIMDNLAGHVRSVVNDILNRIKSSEVELSNVELSIEEIIIVENPKVRVKININNDLGIYEISKDQNKLEVIQILKNHN
jgi:hypothetical protein